MLDIKNIRANSQEIETKLKTKEADVSLKEVLLLDEKIREKKTRVETLKAEKNHISAEIGKLKRNGENVDAIMQKVSDHSDEIMALDHEIKALDECFKETLSAIPNIPMDDVPVSLDPKDNVEVKRYKEKPQFSFPVKNHIELNEKLSFFDFPRGAKVTGSGWPIYKGMGARLEWALINFMIDFHVKNGYELYMTPLVARKEILFGSGQLPKFDHQQYKFEDDGQTMYLIPTAEVVLNGLHYDEIMDAESLPKRYTAYTSCFRREAGALGAQERGLIRVHQFNKVEMFVFSKPDESDKMFNEMVQNAETILEELELHYRTMLLVTGDMSFAASKTVDVEVWLPGQDRYYEVSSISNCTDYQARRSKIRYREKGEKAELVHTLNGSGLATSRLLVSIIENNQQPDGSIVVPKALQPYLGGIELIEPV